MMANGLPITFSFEGDETRCAGYMPKARAMLERLAALDPGATFQDKKVLEDGSVEIMVRKVGQTQKARIVVEDYPQIGFSQLESIWNGQDSIPLTAYLLMDEAHQPEGTPEEYGRYGFGPRHLLQNTVWTWEVGHTRFRGVLLHKNRFMLLTEDGVFAAQVFKEKTLDSAYPGSHSLGQPWKLNRLFDLPYYIGQHWYYGWYWHGIVPVNTGFWHNYLADSSGFVSEADFKQDGDASKPVDLLLQTELIAYSGNQGTHKTLLRLDTLAHWQYSLYVINGCPTMTACMAANERRLFLAGSASIEQGNYQNHTRIYLSFAVWDKTGNLSYSLNNIIYDIGYDNPEVEIHNSPWGAFSCHATPNYLYLLLARFRVGTTSNTYMASRLLILDAVTLQLIQVIEGDHWYYLLVQYNQEQQAVAIEMAYENDGFSNPDDKGIIVYTRVYDVTIDKNSRQHTFTQTHRHKLWDTTKATGSGTQELANELRISWFINTHPSTHRK